MRKIDMRPDMQPASWCAGTFIFLHESYTFLHELRNGVKANGMLQAGGCPDPHSFDPDPRIQHFRLNTDPDPDPGF
jgi:hypothetical protein